MRKTIFFIYLVIIIGIILFSSCLPKENLIRELIPKETVVYVQAKNVDELLNNTDSFLNELGLKTFIGTMPLKEIVSIKLSSIMENEIDHNWFDLEKPAGIAYIPPFNNENLTGSILILLPVKKEKDNNDSIKKIIQGKENIEIGFFKDYAVLAVDYNISSDYPPEENLDISGLDKYKDNSLSYYFDFSKIWELGKTEWEGFKESFNSTIVSTINSNSESPIADSSSLSKQQIINIYSALFSFIEQITEIDGSIIADKSGIAFYGNSFFDETEDVGELLKSIAPVKNSKEFIKYIPEDYLFSFISNFTRDDKKKCLNIFYKLLFSVVDADSTLVDKYKNIAESFIDKLGAESSVAFDLDINFEKIMKSYEQGAGVEVLPDSISDIIDIKMIAVYEAENPDEIKKILKKSIDDSSYESIINSLTSSVGIEIELSLIEKEINGFVYDEFSLDLDFSKYLEKIGAGDDSLEKINAILSNMFSSIKLFIAYKNNRVYMVINKTGSEVLKELVISDKCSDGIMENSKYFRKVLDEIPDDAHLIYQYSIKRLVNIINKIPELNYISEIKIPDAPGFIGYMKIESNRIEGASFFSLIEMRKYFGEIIKRFQNPVF